MFTNEDIQVKLVNGDEVKEFVKRHGEFAAICYNTPKKYAEKIGKSVLSDGHYSGSRADFFRFEVILAPRYTVDQAVRHEQGVVKNVQSQRYVDMSNFNLYVTDLVANDEYLREEMRRHEEETQERYKRMKKYLEDNYHLSGEKANDQIRGILPIGSESKFNFALNIEGLVHFMNMRLCTRADKPIRILAKKMREEVRKVTLAYDELLVPMCESRLYCTEKNTCGMYPRKEELRAKLKE